MAVTMGELSSNSKLTSDESKGTNKEAANGQPMATKTAGDTSEICSGEAAEQPTKAVIEYIGNGIWTDAIGKKWTHGTVERLKIDYCRSRSDIMWMVLHGEMKMTEV